MNKLLSWRFTVQDRLSAYRSVHYLRSQLFIPSAISIDKKATLNTPDAKCTSSSILELNGFISDAGSGLTTYLPLGKRVLDKIIRIIKTEMNSVGGQEIEMPCLSDLNMWKKSGRDALIGSELFRLNDRKSRALCLCPTHEEIVTSLVAKFAKLIPKRCLGETQSLNLYQITHKFRDEGQPQHSLLRSREFIMKDMYSFHTSESLALETYEKVCVAYENVYKRLDLNYIKACASVGAMGGTMSHEFHIESPMGEDKVYTCPTCLMGFNIDLAVDLRKSDDSSLTTNDVCQILKCNCQPNSVDAKVLPKKSIEIGHTFILGDRYTKVFPIRNEVTKNIIMGCYGIGVSRLVQTCVEQRQQESLYPNWPYEISPFKVVIIPPKAGSKEEAKGNELLKQLVSEFRNNVEFYDDVVVDDRVTETIGSRIIDAKLMGAAYTIVLGKNISNSEVEILINSTTIQNLISETRIVTKNDAVLKILNELHNCYQESRKN